MGEKISDLGTLSFKEHDVIIELNQSSNDFSSYDIHIQTEGIRLELTQQEFIVAAITLLAGADKLRELKKINAESL